MEPQAFDRLARTFSQSASRRRALGGLIGGALAAVAGTTSAVAKDRHRRGGKGRHHPAQGADQPAALQPASAGGGAAKPAPAVCLPLGKHCSQPTSGQGHAKDTRKGKGKPPACSKCCSRFGAPDPNGKARCTCKGEGVACGNDSQCCGGRCKSGSCTGCPGDTVFCTDSCADLQTNNQHCGSCETACDADQRCVNGSCACPGDTVFCTDGCADLQTNQQHCGSCDNACAVGQRCVNGSCACDEQSCPTGCCDGTSCKRGTSLSACGNDGAPCALCQSGATCNDGTCTCASGKSCTGSGCCASADQVCDQNDQCCTKTTCAKAGKNCGTIPDGCGGTPLNCGTCTLPQTCGGCVTANVCCCGDDGTACQGLQCGDATNNCGQPVHCGDCSDPFTCSNPNGGTCVCPSGQSPCNGACVDFNTDPNNCGGCGTSANTCPVRSAGQVACNGGLCCSADQQPCAQDSDCCPCDDGSGQACTCSTGQGVCVMSGNPG